MIYSATVYPCWAAVASVLVFGSLFFILIWFFSYVCPQMLTSSKSHRLTATSYRNRQYRIDGISPFEGSLFLVFAVAVFFVGSTEAVESSCEGNNCLFLSYQYLFKIIFVFFLRNKRIVLLVRRLQLFYVFNLVSIAMPSS